MRMCCISEPVYAHNAQNKQKQGLLNHDREKLNRTGAGWPLHAGCISKSKLGQEIGSYC